MNAIISSQTVTNSIENKPQVQLKNLTVTLNDKPILRNVDFHLEKKQCVAITGPSGAGKSTFLQLLAGICFGEVEGHIEHFGAGCLVSPDSRIGLVPQGLADNLNPHMTVAEHLQDSLSVHHSLSRREKHKRICDLTSQVALPHTLLKRYPRHLSGGEIQRVLLALALVSDPEILLLDEPTAALDEDTRNQIYQLLVQQRHRRTIVFVTHDFRLASALAETVVRMQSGQLIERVPAHQLSPSINTDTTENLKEPSVNPRLPVLALRQLNVSHHGRALFREFTLDLPRGSLTLVYGNSGSGKTTLARMLAGWDPLPEGADLSFYGKAVLLAQHARAACAGHFTLRQILEEPLTLSKKRVDSALLRHWLQQVCLPDTDSFLQRHPGSLSGGELQRLLLARAMLSEPELLIADEPTSALDPALREEMISLFLAVQRTSGCTLLIFTHDKALTYLTGQLGRQLTPSGLAGATTEIKDHN